MRNHNLDYGHPYRITGLDAITKIYHIKYKIYEKEDFKSYEEIIATICEKINNGNMVAVTVDSYGCTWSHFYLDQHMFHTITLESYDPERKVFLSSDSYLEEKRVEISKECLLKYLSWFIVFSAENKKDKISRSNVVTFVKDYLLQLEDRDVREPLKKIYDSLKKYTYSEKDIEYYKYPDKSIFLIRFIALSWSRFNFAEALVSLDSVLGGNYFAEVADRIKKLSSDWAKVRNVLVVLMQRASKENDFVFDEKYIANMPKFIEDEVSVLAEMKKIASNL
ncbi:hypothetical protein [Butyrivibrio sp. M55]|uniref:hypothetical protein n=1 Tax=Butyrivibrio sp. M55 TaxID=1855323 RepID=UPI0011135C44|nr:hypothetical protein [Butyrivibrio sp. M55]